MTTETLKSLIRETIREVLSEEFHLFTEIPATKVTPDEIAEGWQQLTQLIQNCQVDLPIQDLAQNHDQYLHHRI